MLDIEYSLEPDLTVEEFVDVLRRSTLAERRPVAPNLSDLAVDVAFQRRGIGRELIRQTHLGAGLNTSLILLAAPKAETYYPHIGMLHHNSCWRLERVG